MRTDSVFTCFESGSLSNLCVDFLLSLSLSHNIQIVVLTVFLKSNNNLDSRLCTPIFHKQKPILKFVEHIFKQQFVVFSLELSVSLSTDNNNNKRRKFIINLSSRVLFLSNHSQNKYRKRPKRVDILYDFCFEIKP